MSSQSRGVGRKPFVIRSDNGRQNLLLDANNQLLQRISPEH